MRKNAKKFKLRLKVIFLLLMVFLNFFTNTLGINAVAKALTIADTINDIYISEVNYENDMKNLVEPYIDKKMESGFVDGEENVKLYYEEYKVENAKANIVISHGYTESLEKYHEMIYYFLKEGYNVFGIEHRGHGRSGTLGIADETQIDVKNFNQYVTDFKRFMDEIVIPNKEGKKIFLFAHSMGGAIGAEFLEEYPEYFDAAILSAPMLEVNTGNIPKFIAEIIVSFEVAIGNGGAYVLGKKPYTPEYNKDEIGTTSLNRYEYVHDIVANNKNLQRGGASYNWTKQAFTATEEIIKDENASKVKIPVLLFQAGHDTYVKSEGQDKFAKAAKDCEIIRVDNSRHEIYLEKDEIQKLYLKEVFNFYDNKLIDK